MNAYRHGLTGQLDVRTPEEQEAHDKFCAGIVSSVAPAEGVERQFAQSIAEDHWRRVTCEETVRHSASEPYPRNVLATRSTRGRRARTIENNIFALACSFTAAQARSVRCDADFEEDSTGETESPEIDQALSDARTFVADPTRCHLLTIYERRVHSNMTKNMKRLIEIQAIRHAVATKEKAARLHTQLAEMEGVTCVSPSTSRPEWVRLFNCGNLPGDPQRQPPESGQTRRILQLGPINPPRRMTVLLRRSPAVTSS